MIDIYLSKFVSKKGKTCYVLVIDKLLTKETCYLTEVEFNSLQKQFNLQVR